MCLLVHKEQVVFYIVAKNDLELPIFLSPPPKCWDHRLALQCPVWCRAGVEPRDSWGKHSTHQTATQPDTLRLEGMSVSTAQKALLCRNMEIATLFFSAHYCPFFFFLFIRSKSLSPAHIHGKMSRSTAWRPKKLKHKNVDVFKPSHSTPLQFEYIWNI